MRQLHKSNHLLACLCLVVGAGYVVGLPPGSAQAEEQGAAETGKVVAKVNGKPIYEERLKPEVDKGLGMYRKYGMRKENPDLVKRLQRKALDRLIGEELLSQESRKLTVEDIDEKVEQKVMALKRKYGPGERFEKYLKMRNLTLEEAKKSFRVRVQTEEYLKKQGISDPEIPEERIRELYESDPKSYSRDEFVRVGHILIGVDGHAGDEEKQQQARQKAEQIHKEVLGGKDFGEMAKEHSTCNSASGGGDLGNIKKGYMPEEFETVAFTIEKGAVSKVVKTKFGYHIIKVLDKKPAGVMPYEEVKGFITKYLQQDESKKKLAAHMTELKTKAKIEILLPE
jgi:peptidyl-prolyl cis-trans isomerase C